MATGEVIDGNDDLADQEIKRILELETIAVVGMSRNPFKPAHYVPRYMMEQGYKTICVNPFADEILGLKCYKSLGDVHEPVEVVDVFRPSKDVPPVMDESIAKGVKAVWLQQGIHNPEAEEKARRHGIAVIWNRCIMVEHKRLFS